MILETNCYVYIIVLWHQYLKDHLLRQSDRCVRETFNKAHLFYAENKSNMMNENIYVCLCIIKKKPERKPELPLESQGRMSRMDVGFLHVWWLVIPCLWEVVMSPVWQLLTSFDEDEEGLAPGNSQKENHPILWYLQAWTVQQQISFFIFMCLEIPGKDV